MRKDVACILAGVALLFALVLYFQQQPVKKAEPMRVGVVYLAPYRVFTYQVVQDIKELSEQNPDISVSFLDGDNKVEQQRALIHRLAAGRIYAAQAALWSESFVSCRAERQLYLGAAFAGLCRCLPDV